MSATIGGGRWGGPPVSVPPPVSFPEYDVDTSVPGRLTVRFWDTGSGRRGKPAGVHGAEIRWEMREDVPAKEEYLTDSEPTYVFVYRGQAGTVGVLLPALGKRYG